MSTDLIRTGDAGLATTADDLRRQVAEVAEHGGPEALHEVARRASAAQEYEKRNNAKERADYFGRVRVFAEAHIGLLDIQEHRHARGSELHIGNEVITRGVRQHWRLLGGAMKIGALEPAMDRVGRDQWSSITTGTVRRELQVCGWTFVKPQPLRKRYLERKATPGLGSRGQGIREYLASFLQCRPESVSHYMRAGGNGRIPLATAIILADALEVPYGELTPVPPRVQPKRHGRRRPRARKLPGGRLDEAYSFVRRALQELDRAAGQGNQWGTAAAWEHLYEAEDIIGRALKRAV